MEGVVKKLRRCVADDTREELAVPAVPLLLMDRSARACATTSLPLVDRSVPRAEWPPRVEDESFVTVLAQELLLSSSSTTPPSRFSLSSSISLMRRR